MLKINLSPQRRDDTLELLIDGTILTINGDTLDLSQIPNGSSYPNANELHEFLVGSIVCDNDNYEITVILPLSPNPTQEQSFPIPLIITTNGNIKLPTDITLEENND